MIKALVLKTNQILSQFSKLDFVALLAVRLYLLPLLFEGARTKILGFHNTVAWFAAPVAKGGLHMPFPELMAYLAVGTEAAGLVLIALGLCTRLITIPLMVLMGVAGMVVHWAHGWALIASYSMESTLRLNDLMAWLAENFPGRYNYATALGDPAIINNGVELSVTYFVLLLVLFCFGGGRYVSADYWLKKYIMKWASKTADKS